MTIYKDRLSRRELGQLLQLIADDLYHERDVSTLTLFNYFQQFHLPSQRESLEVSSRCKDQLLNLLTKFRTGEELREFLQVAYKKRIPYRLSKEVMNYIGIGIIYTSHISADEAISVWERRNRELSSEDIYQKTKTELLDMLNNPSLFPDGYSIVTFAKKFNINLPKMESRELPIQVLMEKLFERPSSTKRIGRWGLKDEEKK